MAATMSAAKTLADMTPEQRKKCEGMWAEHKHPLYVGLEVITHAVGSGAHLHDPKSGSKFLLSEAVLHKVTPRFDLPRAWAPDGMPLDVDVEQEIVRPHPRGGVIGGYDNPTYTDLPEGTAVRRFVTKWEPVKEDA